MQNFIDNPCRALEWKMVKIVLKDWSFKVLQVGKAVILEGGGGGGYNIKIGEFFFSYVTWGVESFKDTVLAVWKVYPSFQKKMSLADTCSSWRESWGSYTLFWTQLLLLAATWIIEPTCIRWWVLTALVLLSWHPGSSVNQIGIFWREVWCQALRNWN